jgi:hypothetical protein
MARKHGTNFIMSLGFEADARSRKVTRQNYALKLCSKLNRRSAEALP